MSKNFKIIGEIEAYDLDKLTEDLFIFFQENDNIGTFSVDFKDDEVEIWIMNILRYQDIINLIIITS
mgnify:CR=1 FL=1